MEQKLKDQIRKLQYVKNLLFGSFVGKEELIELMATCVVAQEHLLIVGPPGTAKSELIKRFALLCSPQQVGQEQKTIPYFEYLLTRFTEPNEIFGPIDIQRFRDGGGHRRVIDRMLPQAEIAFLDEVFKANSAILNALLTLLNERVFYNSNEVVPVPLISSIGATNEVPDDPNLAAIYDRFLVRLWTDNVEENLFSELFNRGWELEKVKIRSGSQIQLANVTTTDDLRGLYQNLYRVQLNAVEVPYRAIVRQIRSEGISLSDRRVVKLLKLISASALLDQRLEATPKDFWVLKYVWNKPEQITHLEKILEPHLHDGEKNTNGRAKDIESLKRALDSLTSRKPRLEQTDTEFFDFLHQAHGLRKDIEAHGNTEEANQLRKEMKQLLDETMSVMQERG